MSFKRLSPLRYPGGKAKILEFIIKLIETNNSIGKHYVEPYAGGAGVALGLLINGYVSDVHINDIDDGIYSFWKSILKETDLFIEKIYNTPITLDEWKIQKYIYNNLGDFSCFEKGFATFFLNRCNRSGVITGGCIGGKDQLGEYKLDARFNKDDLVKRIKRIAQYSDHIHLYNEDTYLLLQNNPLKFSESIIYLDPPYYEKGYCLYRNHYGHQDHVRLADLLKKLNTLWIASYDNVPEIIDIYSGLRKREFNIHYSAGQKKQGKEVMFFSDLVVIPEKEIYS